MREKKAAIAYLRVSGLGQVDGDGLPRQADAVTAYAKHAGLTIIETYQDRGVSGTKDLEDRPGLAALLDRVESNGVRIVLDRILKLRRHGNPMKGARLSFQKIAATLNTEGVATRTGKPWAPATVFGIVKRLRPALTAEAK